MRAAYFLCIKEMFIEKNRWIIENHFGFLYGICDVIFFSAYCLCWKANFFFLRIIRNIFQVQCKKHRRLHVLGWSSHSCSALQRLVARPSAIPGIVTHLLYGINALWCTRYFRLPSAADEPPVNATANESLSQVIVLCPRDRKLFPDRGRETPKGIREKRKKKAANEDGEEKSKRTTD